MSIKRQLYDKVGFLLILFSLIVFKSFGQSCVINTNNPSFETPNFTDGSSMHRDNSGLTSNHCSDQNAGHVYDLPAGTYYYVVRFIDKTKDKNNTDEEVFDGYFELK